MALQGTLDTFSLPDVLRLLATTAKTGRLRLDGDRGRGSVWMRDGAVVAAEADRALDGVAIDEVVFELLRFETGSFTFDTGEETDRAGKPEDVENVLRRAGALLSEWNELEVVVPSPDHQVKLTDDLPADEVTVDAERWRSVVAVAAGCRVADLASTLKLSELGVSRVVRDLVDLGVVEVSEPVAPSRDDDTGRAQRRSEGTGRLGRRRLRADDATAPMSRSELTSTGESPRAGWLQADTGSHPTTDEAVPEPPQANGRSSLGTSRGRSSSGDADRTTGSRPSLRSRSQPTDEGPPQPPSTGETPAIPERRERPGSGLTSRLGRDRASRRSGPATGPASSEVPPPPVTPAPPALPSRNGLARRGGPSGDQNDGGVPARGPSPFDGGRLGAGRIDTGQIRAVSSSALPADLHWAADDAGSPPTAPHVFSGLTDIVSSPPPPRSDGEAAPHVSAMSTEARAAVEATVGPSGGLQGGVQAGAPDDMAQRGRLIDFLSSIRS